MRHYIWTAAVVILAAPSAWGHGLLIPIDRKIPPLAMVRHDVSITIDEQAAVTRVEQVFRNHTSRPLEATYIFPLPKDASVQKFSMWVNGREMAGELMEADKARRIYTDIVKRTQDPGLLEYLDNRLLQLKIFPVPPHEDQKIALTYTALAPADGGIVSYTYPLHAQGKTAVAAQAFTLKATIKSHEPIQNIYSPTHAIALDRPNDREARVTLDRDQGGQDFQLYYALGNQAIGMTTLMQRPVSGEPGYFMLLMSPKIEASAAPVPRDVVLVLDTSGSMRGVKIEQAKHALQYCLANLNAGDRFGLMNFATTVNRYRDRLVNASREQLDDARRWVEQLDATGGTAIDDALASALALREESGRGFTIVFFTDGCPTVGETDPEKIWKHVSTKISANTRIFTFGVGDDVNATFLDRLAEQTRAVNTYVRPAEDIEVKVSGMYGKMTHPVVTNLKLTTSDSIHLTEMYPPELPDLFQGGQVIVLGRYSGEGQAALRLSGTVGTEPREFVYETAFASRTSGDRSFVEHLWARRKVGYMLDQIRANGEKKELVDEVVALARKYAIATPYTSYLVVPDGTPIVRGGGVHGEMPMPLNAPALMPIGFGAGDGGGGAPMKVGDFARQNAGDKLAGARDRLEDSAYAQSRMNPGNADGHLFLDAKEKKDAYKRAGEALAKRAQEEVQMGKLGVDLSVQTNNLRNQAQMERMALRNVQGRNCLEIGGVWIDEGYRPEMATVTVKSQSNAYFRMLERQPQMKEVFALSNHLVWVSPSGKALILDAHDGKTDLPDGEIDSLFVAKK